MRRIKPKSVKKRRAISRNAIRWGSLLSVAILSLNCHTRRLKGEAMPMPVEDPSEESLSQDSQDNDDGITILRTAGEIIPVEEINSSSPNEEEEL